MKKETFYISIILLAASLSSFAQSELKRKDLNDKYDWNNSTREQKNKYYFGLEPINTSQKKYHFRYQNSNQIIDLISENGTDFQGQILNTAQENKMIKTNYGTDSKAYNHIFEFEEIPASDASRAGQFILTEKAYLIPTDSLIKHWNFNWLDCSGLDFDYKVKTDFFKKNYTCPHNQKDSVEHVVEIKKLNDTLNKSLDLQKSFSLFKNRLPKGRSYTVDGWINMYIMTENEHESWKNGKPIRDYQKTIKDTIDNYLESELNRLIPNSTELKCYDDYRLIFSKNGRMKKIKVDMGFWERLRDKDYRKCKQLLKKTFKQIKIDFVDPKYMFYRDLSFGQKKIYIGDPTIY